MVLQNSNIAKFSIPGEEHTGPEQSDLKKLARLIDKYAPHDGHFDLSVDGLHIIKTSKVSEIATHMTATTGLCIVAQGAKCCSLAHQNLEYDKSRMIVYAAEVPVSVKITKASKEAPYLCLVVQINPQKLSELIMKVFPRGVPKTQEAQAIYLGKSNGNIVKTAIRLMEIILQQEDSDLIAPLMIDEILIRLLRSPSGPAIAQIGVIDSNVQKISKAITWLKDNYTRSVKINELAKLAGMSVSAFHTHFKNITSISPLQFQKTLRLQEARNLMMTKMMEV